jgi:basic amino acid/polyamine antiporter, APA family
MFSLFSIIVFYTIVVFITTGVLEGHILDQTLTPISTAAYTFMGKFGTITLSIAAILAFVSTGNAGIMAASRYPLALSRDNLLPKFFSKIHKKHKTPYMSIIITGIFMIFVLFLELNILVKVASTVLILTYILTNFSIIILRESHLQNYRPDFKAPLYPWMQIIGIIGFSFLIFEMGLISFVVSLLFIVIGFLVYWFYGRKRTNQEYALLHLLERLTAKELVTGSLEEELKEVIRHRDDIVKDGFDKLVEESSMIDITEKIDYKDFFKIAADKIFEKIDVDSNIILNYY